MAILHFETFPRKPTSEFIVSCLVGSFPPWEKGQPLPKCKPSCWRRTFIHCTPRAQRRVFQRTRPPTGDTSLPGQDAGPRAYLAGGQMGADAQKTRYSFLHTDVPWLCKTTELADARADALRCELRTPGPHTCPPIWVTCFPNDQSVIPTPLTV